MKNSLLIVFFAALLGFAFSTETGTNALDVSSAIAKDCPSLQTDSKSKDSKSKDSKSKDSKSKDSKSKDSKSKDSKSKDSKSKDSKSKDSKSKDSKSEECEEEEKVTICHVPLGNPENAQTITTSVQAIINAHTVGAHGGDYMGECVDVEGDFPCECPAGITSCFGPDGEECAPGSTGNILSPKSQRNLHGN